MGSPDETDHKDIAFFPLSPVNRYDPITVFLMFEGFETTTLVSI
jgi:hypothetical protein